MQSLWLCPGTCYKIAKDTKEWYLPGGEAWTEVPEGSSDRKLDHVSLMGMTHLFAAQEARATQPQDQVREGPVPSGRSQGQLLGWKEREEGGHTEAYFLVGKDREEVGRLIYHQGLATSCVSFLLCFRSWDLAGFPPLQSWLTPCC